MWPSPWAMAGPSAMRRTVQLAAHRTSMVSAPPSAAMSRSPGRTPAPVSCAPVSRSRLSSPGCLFARPEKRSAR
ncbi:MAG TPA: hypothetical protein VFB06_35240 [Streptosporangiaceae bacterium]|nr:hypothetical protein [Streptosporangiaceae bacterium]